MARRILAALLLLAGAASAALAVRGVFVAGVHWDAGIDTQASLDITSLAPGSSLEQAYEAVFWTSEFYGTLVQTLAEILRGLFTGATDHLLPDMRETYLWQGCITVAIAVIGAAGLGWAIGRVTRSLVAGAFAWALLWSVPLWAGMSHINAKDVPVAAGLTLISSALMLVLQRRPTRADAIAGIAMAAIGGALAMGQRGGTWPLVLTLGAAGIGCAVIARIRRPDRTRGIAISLAATVAAFAAGLVVIWLTNPIARIDLPQWLLDAFGVARAYPMDLNVRMAGMDVNSQALPWWYVPAWLGAQLPVLTTIAVLAGIVALAVALARPRMRGTAAAFAPLAVQGIAFPILIVVMGGTLYSGLRHVLFIVPALIGLAAFPVAWLDRASRSPRTTAAIAAWTVLPCALGLVSVVQWFPYAYASVNPVALQLAPGRGWDLDAWGVSGMEGVLRLRELGQELVAVAPSDFPVKIVGGLTLETVQAQSPREFGYYQFIAGDPKPLPPGCEPAFTIARAGQDLGLGAVCRR